MTPDIENTLRKEELPAGSTGETGPTRESDVFVFPMSFGQQRMWFLDQFQRAADGSGSPFYNIPSAIRLTGKLNVAALRRALNEIVDRHEALRTTFGRVEGEPSQLIAPSPDPQRTPDRPGRPAARRSARPRPCASPRKRRGDPLTWLGGRSCAPRLIRLTPEEHLALITMHHIVSDGWSMSVFVAGIERAVCRVHRRPAHPAPAAADPVRRLC